MSHNVSIADLGLNSRFTYSRDQSPILKSQCSWTTGLFHEMKKLQAEQRASKNPFLKKSHWKKKNSHKIIGRPGRVLKSSPIHFWPWQLGQAHFQSCLSQEDFYLFWAPRPDVLIQRKRIPLILFCSYLALLLISEQNYFPNRVVSTFHQGKML